MDEERAAEKRRPGVTTKEEQNVSRHLLFYFFSYHHFCFGGASSTSGSADPTGLRRLRMSDFRKSETHTGVRIAIAEDARRIDEERAAAKRMPGVTTKDEQLPSAVCP